MCKRNEHDSPPPGSPGSGAGLRPRPAGFMPADFPVNTPSPLQGRLAHPSQVSGKTAPKPTATRANQHPVKRMGVGKDRRNETWEVPAPNWGSRGVLRFSHFVNSPTTSRVQDDDTFIDRGDLRPMWDYQAPIHRRQYPTLDNPTWRTGRVTEKDYLALAKARNQAKAKAAGRR
jgi:hypothetical protein